MEIISQPWPWYIAGPAISMVLFFLLYFGKTFGISGNYRTICAAVGAGKNTKFFDFNWKNERWNLVFIMGTLIGAAIAKFWFFDGTSEISDATIADLQALGLSYGDEMVPLEIFGIDQLLTLRGMTFLIFGGLLVGFGTRYAGGCTSGHAITGLSDFQLPSLVAVIGFFIGGMFMTFLLLPYLVNL